MGYNELSQQEIEALRQFDTCTLSDALERLSPRLRNEDFINGETCRFPGLPAVAGYAVTGKIRFSMPPVLLRARHRSRGVCAGLSKGPSVTAKWRPRSCHRRASLRVPARLTSLRIPAWALCRRAPMPTSAPACAVRAAAQTRSRQAVRRPPFMQFENGGEGQECHTSIWTIRWTCS